MKNGVDVPAASADSTRKSGMLLREEVAETVGLCRSLVYSHDYSREPATKPATARGCQENHARAPLFALVPSEQ